MGRAPYGSVNKIEKKSIYFTNEKIEIMTQKKNNVTKILHFILLLKWAPAQLCATVLSDADAGNIYYLGSLILIYFYSHSTLKHPVYKTASKARCSPRLHSRPCTLEIRPVIYCHLHNNCIKMRSQSGAGATLT